MIYSQELKEYLLELANQPDSLFGRTVTQFVACTRWFFLMHHIKVGGSMMQWDGNVKFPHHPIYHTMKVDVYCFLLKAEHKLHRIIFPLVSQSSRWFVCPGSLQWRSLVWWCATCVRWWTGSRTTQVTCSDNIFPNNFYLKTNIFPTIIFKFYIFKFFSEQWRGWGGEIDPEGERMSSTWSVLWCWHGIIDYYQYVEYVGMGDGNEMWSTLWVH